MGSSAGDNPTGPGEAAPDPASIEADLEAARALILSGDRAAALERCLLVLDREDLPVTSACTLSVMLRGLGQTQAADHIRDIVLDGLRRREATASAAVDDVLQRAEIYTDLGAYDEAEALCRRLVDQRPDDIRATNALLNFLCFRARPDEACAVAEAFCARAGDAFATCIYFATVFDHLGSQDSVIRFLERAETDCTTPQRRARLDYLRAANGLEVAALDQQSMAVGIFDSFAETYDSQLAKIENNGPSMVYTALRELRLDDTPTRRVLDAGCGTGLCAGFLRRYAREIVGADLSVGMLEKARAKQVYDVLVRTDLSLPETYPQGSFDLVVCADVLVYFGALETVFANFERILSPGGWLILTVETEAEPKDQTGYRLLGSGRYKHADRYLLDTLAQVGLPAPALLEHARLRNELADPVFGTVLAVQKPPLPPA